MCQTKLCKKCSIIKPVEDFYKCSKHSDGLQYQCKECDSIKRKERWNLNKEDEAIKNKVYYQNNKDRCNQYSSTYFQKNKDKLIQQRKDRRQNSVKEKLIHNYRGIISSSFKRALDGKSVKRCKSLEILGCSMEEFILYIESYFTDDMDWSNYGACLESDCRVWNLDHTYPISLAETEEEILKLNHYTNFKPMWAVENIRKSNNI
jgi:hypothetical protein